MFQKIRRYMTKQKYFLFIAFLVLPCWYCSCCSTKCASRA